MGLEVLPELFIARGKALVTKDHKVRLLFQGIGDAPNDDVGIKDLEQSFAYVAQTINRVSSGENRGTAPPLQGIRLPTYCCEQGCVRRYGCAPIA